MCSEEVTRSVGTVNSRKPSSTVDSTFPPNRNTTLPHFSVRLLNPAEKKRGSITPRPKPLFFGNIWETVRDNCLVTILRHTEPLGVPEAVVETQGVSNRSTGTRVINRSDVKTKEWMFYTYFIVMYGVPQQDPEFTQVDTFVNLLHELY